MVTRLKLLRTGRGLTQWDLSHAIAISPSRYSLIERGKLSPSDEERERLAQILEAPASTLLRQACRARPSHSPQVVASMGGT
jgi:transcriptional regulator with XRE-family HTH domain